MEGHLNVIKMQLPISFYIASKEETERQIAVAGEFIELVEKYCMEHNIS